MDTLPPSTVSGICDPLSLLVGVRIELRQKVGWNFLHKALNLLGVSTPTVKHLFPALSENFLTSGPFHRSHILIVCVGFLLWKTQHSQANLGFNHEGLIWTFSQGLFRDACAQS